MMRVRLDLDPEGALAKRGFPDPATPGEAVALQQMSGFAVEWRVFRLIITLPAH